MTVITESAVCACCGATVEVAVVVGVEVAQEPAVRPAAERSPTVRGKETGHARKSSVTDERESA